MSTAPRDFSPEKRAGAKDGEEKRQTVGEMKPDRWRSANKSLSDSWKRLIQPAISADLKLTTEMCRNGQSHVLSM